MAADWINSALLQGLSHARGFEPRTTPGLPALEPQSVEIFQAHGMVRIWPAERCFYEIGRAHV